MKSLIVGLGVQGKKRAKHLRKSSYLKFDRLTKSSDYKKSKVFNKKLKSICSKFCNKSDQLKIEIENLSKK